MFCLMCYFANYHLIVYLPSDRYFKDFEHELRVSKLVFSLFQNNLFVVFRSLLSISRFSPKKCLKSSIILALINII